MSRRPTIDWPNFMFMPPLQRPGICRLRIYEADGMAPVVVATDRADNPGMSITNAAEVIAQAAYLALGKPVLGIFYIEHYDAPSDPGGGEFDRQQEFSHVRFVMRGEEFTRPVWTHLSAEAVREIAPDLLGGAAAQ